MSLTTPDPATNGHTHQAEVRATIEVLAAPIFTGQRSVLLVLLQEQLLDLPYGDLLSLRNDVFHWMTQVRLDQAAGVHPKHNPRALHQVMMLLD